MSEEEFEDIEDNTHRTQVLPAFEIVKRDILFSWFTIEKEYQDYIRLTSLGKLCRIENLSAKIISLHATILKPMMKKKYFAAEFGEFVNEMDKYIFSDGENKKIPEDKIDQVIEKFAEFIFKLKLTDISFEVKPWEERFKDSYGVF